MKTAVTFPKKLFYRINEVADIVGVEAYVLRYWETKFPMLKPERMSNDERRYRQKEVELLLRIRQLLHREKYTIAGAVERLQREAAGEVFEEPTPVPAAKPFNGTDGDKAELFEGDLFGSSLSEARTQLVQIRRELSAIHESL